MQKHPYAIAMRTGRRSIMPGGLRRNLVAHQCAPFAFLQAGAGDARNCARRDGRLYGLGMGNMKGALAAMCVATAILSRRSNAWKGPLSGESRIVSICPLPDPLRRTLPRRQDRTIRLPIFRNLDGADAVEQIGGDVVWHHLAEWWQRPVGVGAAHGKAKRPGINGRAAPGANDNLKFRIALRAPAQCRHVTGEGYLNFAGRLVAQERNRHICEFKPAFVRAASGAPDELLLFLYRFLQSPGNWHDVEDRRLLDRHGIRRRLARLVRLRGRHKWPSGGRGAEQRDELASM